MAKKRSHDDPQLPGAIDAATGREPMLPVRGEQFELMTAPTAAIRMQRLCRFIEYWLGPRLPEYGEPPQVLERVALPEPLRILYAFAGRWPDPRGRRRLEHDVPAFSGQDSLSSLSHVRVADDGSIFFVRKNQRVWKCHTLPTGDDPPVVCIEQTISLSLSRFLVTFVLAELCRNAWLTIDDEKLDSQFTATARPTDAIWLNGPYGTSTWENRTYDFHLWNGILVGEMDGLRYFAARDADSKAFLNANRSPIDSLNVQFGDAVILEVFPDGSGRFQTGHNQYFLIQPGNLDFVAIHDILLAAVSEEGNCKTDATVRFNRSGQRDGHLNWFIRDRRVFRSLFSQALRVGGTPPSHTGRVLKVLGL